MTIDNCNSFCEVYDCFSNDRGHSYSTAGLTTEIFATGAAFGRFISGNASSQAIECTAWGKVHALAIGAGADKKSYIGRFIGYTQSDYTMDATNRVNMAENGTLPDNGGVFKGAN